jgi:glycerate kinase
MARALGIKFLDASGIETGEGGGNIEKIGQIDISTLDSRIRECKIYAASDVSNVLAGPDGAAYVFGPQKGADPAKVRILDDNLQHLSKKIMDTLHIDVGSLVGGGAAGGMGAGIVAFLGGALKNGFQLIADVVKLEEWIRWSDLVITGEGKMDSQTAFGKTPAGVARMSALQNKPVISFAGSLDEKSEKLKNLGFSAIVPIADRPISLQQSLNEAGRLLEDASERTFRLIVLGKGL